MRCEENSVHVTYEINKFEENSVHLTYETNKYEELTRKNVRRGLMPQKSCDEKYEEVKAFRSQNKLS